MGDTTHDSTIDLGTVCLATVERGTGTPVVLVHGSNSDYRTWDPVLDPMGSRFRTIAYSRRYHWPNAAIPEGADYCMREHVDDLERLIRGYELESVQLVGHSYGAFVALLFAMRQPRLVRSLVLAEPPVLTLFTSGTPTPTEMLRLLLTRPRTAFAIAKFGATGVGPATTALRRGDLDTAFRRFSPAVLGRSWFERLSKERLDQARTNLIPAELLGSGFADLDDEAVRSVSCPVLLLEGEHSPRLFHRLADRLFELLPHARRVQIPGASHIMHEDNPEAWARAVVDFATAV